MSKELRSNPLSETRSQPPSDRGDRNRYHNPTRENPAKHRKEPEKHPETTPNTPSSKTDAVQ
jgi:hypothetical protein